MGRVHASITVPGRAVEAERVWYDPVRWPSWIDGFGRVVSLDDSWPRKGSRLVWDSPPGGGGRVVERVTAYEMRSGQTVAIEDARLDGVRAVVFEPRPDSVGVTLRLEYSLKERSPLAPVADLLVVRRSLGESLRRTLRRFASELAAERQFGPAR